MRQARHPVLARAADLGGRAAPHVALAVAAALGAWLFGVGVADQGRRLYLELTQGLGFTDPACTTGYCDYAMFWLAGFLVRHGAAGVLYEPARYAAAAAAILPYKTGYWPFVYPPTMLLPARVISWMPLVAGYYAFCLAATGAAVLLLRRAGVAGWCILVGLCGPAAMWNLYLGQFGLLCGALLVAGLAGLQTRPLRSGGALALLSVKPQYALLVPVVVLAGRHWRALATGVVVLALALGLSVMGGGALAWAGYFGPGREAMAALLGHKFGGYQVMGDSVFWMARSLGAAFGTALAAQLAMACLAALWAWRLWRQSVAEPMRRLIITVFLSLLASPYGFTDDLAVCSVLLPMLARANAPWRNAALAWLWLAPALIPRFVAMFGFLPTPLLLLAALCLAQQKQPLLTEQIGQRA